MVDVVPEEAFHEQKLGDIITVHSDIIMIGNAGNVKVLKVAVER